MDAQRRIAQFEELCNDDPSNDMAFFSLGGAYAQAERHDDAARAYQKCIDINPQMSKAYQLGAKALLQAGRKDDAVALLRAGYTIADERGDMLPRDGMGDMLRDMGETPPKPAAAAAAAAPQGDMTDHATARPGHKMPHPPFRGPVGAWIHDNITRETFDEWIGLGTKIINELKLDLSRDEHDDTYDYGMRRFLRLDDDTYRDITGGKQPPQPPAEYRQALDMILGRVSGAGTDLEEFQGSMDKQIGG